MVATSRLARHKKGVSQASDVGEGSDRTLTIARHPIAVFRNSSAELFPTCGISGVLCTPPQLSAQACKRARR
jgi:hypothetical protein